MGLRALFTLAVWLIAASSWSKGLELTLLAGWTAPTYEQRFLYRPDIVIPPIPGIDVRQEGVFQLDARGGFAFGGSAAYYFTDFIGIEGRIDTVDFNIDTVAPRFVATVDLPAPLPPLGAELDLGRGAAEVERLYPLSVNLKARTPGRARLVVSGGLSYLPRLRLTARQSIGLGVTGIAEQLEIATVAVQAEALPDEEDEGRLGFNVGAGAEVQVASKLALTAEVRFFRFQKQTFVWRRTTDPVSPLEDLVLQELEKELSPIELEPTFFQVTGGIVVRF
jgi:opacity protein-like surface antigen